MQARALVITALLLSGAPAIGCGGRLLDDSEAGAEDAATDVAAEGPYTGEWCDPDTGPTAGPGGDAIHCTKNPYSDAAEYCHRAYLATVQWGCCTPDDPLCCPLAAHMEDHGYVDVTCCASDTDCTECCDGIDPKP